MTQPIRPTTIAGLALALPDPHSNHVRREGKPI